MSRNTLAALATPPGRGGIATVLLAGPRAERILTHLFRTPSGRSVGKWPRNRLRFGVIAREDERIDEVIAGRVGDGLLGADCIEIHCHAGPAATAALLDALRAEGAASADAQKVLAGSEQCSAIQSDVLSALPHAGTAKAADLILSQFEHGLGEAAGRWLDDPTRYRDEIRAVLATWPAGRMLTTPARVVLAGPTNAGKSSLANRLLARPASLVHETPGTTRDYVTGLGEIGGFAMCVIDTAGLGFGDSDIDRQASGFAHEQIDAADAVLALFDAAAPPGETDRELMAMWRKDPRAMIVANKTDLAPVPPWLGEAESVVAVSAGTGAGIDRLSGQIVGHLGLDRLTVGEPLCFTRRQRDLLAAAADGDSTAAARLLREQAPR